MGRFFFFAQFFNCQYNISLHCLLASVASGEKLDKILFSFLYRLRSCYSCILSRFFSLSLIFFILKMICFSVVFW